MPVSNEEVLAAVAKLAEQVQRIAAAMEKQQDRKSYQAEYYKRRKAKKAEAAARAKRLSNKDRHCLDGPRDLRLPFAAWAGRMKAFADRGLSAYNFITWLAWTWNHNTYEHVPITRSGGYMHVFIGMSGDKPLRTKYSDRDVTGFMRVNTLTRPEQLDTLRDALFWKWTFGCVFSVVSEVEDEGWFNTLGESWHKPLKVAMGGYGCYEIKGHTFDPSERDLEVASKTYGLLRPTLEMIWNAFMRGLFCKEEPFTGPKQ